MARKLRIAVSVFFGVVAIALCGLCVRSYWRLDQLSRGEPPTVTLISNNGYVVWNCLHSRLLRYVSRNSSWHFFSVPAVRKYPPLKWQNTTFKFTASAPHVLLALMAAALAILPWAKSRFSLRGLLLVTTLVAVVLGRMMLDVR